MSDYKELYLPFYFTWRDMTEELSDEELGHLLRALLDNYSDRSVPPELPDKMRIIYKFMLDSALRTHKGQRELSEKRRESANKRWAKKENSNAEVYANECKAMQTDAIKGNENENENEKQNGYGYGNGKGYMRYAKDVKKLNEPHFDAEEAFMKALARSYGDISEEDESENANMD